jgi:hypothetical protein
MVLSESLNSLVWMYYSYFRMSEGGIEGKL